MHNVINVSWARATVRTFRNRTFCDFSQPARVAARESSGLLRQRRGGQSEPYLITEGFDTADLKHYRT